MANIAVPYANGSKILIFDEASVANNQRAAATHYFRNPSISGLGVLEVVAVTYLGGNVIGMVDTDGGFFTVNHSAVSTGSPATLLKRITFPSDLTVPRGCTHIGNNVIAVTDNAGDELFTIDFAGATAGQAATAAKRILLPTGLTAPHGLTHVGNGVVACIDNAGDDFYTFNVSTTANNQRASTIKQILLPSEFGTPRGVTFLGNNIFAVLDQTANQIYTFDLSRTTAGQRASVIKRMSPPATLPQDNDAVPFFFGGLEVLREAAAKPVVTLGLPETAFTGQTVQLTLTGEDNLNISELELTDFTVSAGTLSNLAITGASGTADLQLPSTGSGTVTVSLPVDTLAAGNAAASVSIAYVPTTVVLTPAKMRGVRGETVSIAIALGQDVTLVIGNISADVGTLSNLQGADDTWTVDLTLPTTGSGEVTVSIAENALSVGNVAASAMIRYGLALPNLTLGLPATAFTGQTVQLTITGDAVISGLALSDISADVGTLSNLRGSGQNWTADLTLPNRGTGRATVTIGEMSVSVNYQPTSVSITADETSLLTSQSADLTIALGQDADDFIESDIDVQEGTLSNFQGQDDRYTARVTAPGTGTGNIIISIAANVIGKGNAAASLSIPYEPAPPPLSIEAIDKQFIHFGTKDYDLVVDIGGSPDTVIAKGHMEGFIQDWDAANAQLHIKSDEVTRLIEDVFWDIELRKDSNTLMGQILYDVIKAPPIFQTLSTIHLYRDVPIYWDIIIHNFPDFLRMNSQLVGIKSTIEMYGMNFEGRIDGDIRFSLTSGDINFVILSELGDIIRTQMYPYVIESGNPPAIGTPVFVPKGDYGELVVPDVQNAFSYEWTFQEGDDARWNLFDSTRVVIDPADVTVEYGHLQVTITFPNIVGAESYEYSFQSAAHTRGWTAFTGMLENGMITTIIPGLEDGQEYTLFLRVASPWVGTPIQLTIYGGVFGYALTSTPANQIIIFSTAVLDDAFARRIKRIHLPSEIITPSGIAVSGNTAYVMQRTNNTIYVLDIDVADGATATITRRFTTPENLVGSTVYGIVLEDNTLFVIRNSNGGPIDAFSATTANMQQATLINSYRSASLAPGGVQWRGISLDRDLFIGSTVNLYYFFPRDPMNPALSIKSISVSGSPTGTADIFGDKMFVPENTSDKFFIFNKNISGTLNLENEEDGRSIRYPIGVTQIIDISIPG